MHISVLLIGKIGKWACPYTYKLLLLVQYLVMGVSLNLKLFVTASPEISLSLTDANSQFTIFIQTSYLYYSVWRL